MNNIFTIIKHYGIITNRKEAIKIKNEMVLFTTGVSIISLVNNIFGNISSNIITLLIIMIIDFITGILVSILKKSKKTKSGTLSSNVMFIGLIKKIFMLFICIISSRLDIMLQTNYILNTVVVAFCCNDILSIFENAALIGLPIPKFLINILNEMEEKENGKS